MELGTLGMCWERVLLLRVRAATQANVAPWCDRAVTCARAVAARGTSSPLPLVLIFGFIFSLLKENVNYLSEAKSWEVWVDAHCAVLEGGKGIMPLSVELFRLRENKISGGSSFYYP